MPDESHYKKRVPEPIEVILSWELDYLEGTILKYLSRWRTKNGVDDLLKARRFLDWLIEREGGTNTGSGEPHSGPSSPQQTVWNLQSSGGYNQSWTETDYQV